VPGRGKYVALLPKCATFTKDKLSLWIIIVTVDVDKDKEGSRLWLASWPKALASDPWISPGEREGYRRILERFLDYSRGQR
jgi:hypothetical protein